MDNPHKNHRQRMYKRLQKDGTAGFYDHELLEMLLYFSIPRGDTNGIAHELLREFKTIGGVMKANSHTLMGVDGIGQKSADLFNIIGELFRRGVIKEGIQDDFIIKNIKDAVTYCKGLFLDKRYECLYAICLDIRGGVISDGYIGEGDIDCVPAYTRKVVETALRHTAYTVILAHNHPGGDSTPSSDDNEVTERIRIGLDAVGINLNDHIIISNTGYFSYAASGLLGREDINTKSKAAQKRNFLQMNKDDYKTIE